jgi:hypothetical protein
VIRWKSDGMSGEPKKRFRRRIWWALILTLLLLAYPLSLPPAMIWATDYVRLYRPMFWAMGKSPPLLKVMQWYASFWDVKLTEPRRDPSVRPRW